jgi:GntR family transcriptional regulator
MEKTAPAQARHEQVSNWIRNQIANSHWEAHTKLPSENEFCTQFEVSRVTVRHALQMLENEGLIYRRQGLGSFVRPKPVRQALMQLTDFSEEMSNAGMEASSEVLYFGKENISDPIATCLNVSEGQAVMRLDRLRLGDGNPIALDKTWIPLVYAQFLTEQDLEHQTIFAILEGTYNIQIVRGCYQIEAESANESVAKHLGISIGSPVLSIRRTIYTIHDKPIFVQKRYYLPHRIAYFMEIKRIQQPDSGQDGIQINQFEPLFLTS